MRHGKAKLKMNMSQGRRRAVIKSLARGVFENKRVVTTTERAKAVRPVIEKIITRAKKGTLHDLRQMETILNDRHLVTAIVNKIAPHYKDRNGGYTRIIRYKRRAGDNAEMSILELIGDYVLVEKVEDDKGKKKAKDKEKVKESKKEKTAKKPRAVKAPKVDVKKKEKKAAKKEK